MSVIAAALRHMFAAGMSQDDILAAVADMEGAASDTRIKSGLAASERLRSSAAERMKRYRENRAAAGLDPVFDASKYRASLIERDGPGCGYCDAATATTVDHIVPTSRGGTDDLGNLVLACNACNGGKSGRPLGGQYSLRRASALEAHVLYLGEQSKLFGCSGEQGEHVPGNLQALEAKAPIPPKTQSQTITPSPPKGGSVPKTKLRTGTRMTADFELSPEAERYGIEKLGSAEARQQFERFRDHFLAKDGPDAFTVDWDARWRTWVRNALKFAAERQAKFAGSSNGFRDCPSNADRRTAAIFEAFSDSPEPGGMASEATGEHGAYDILPPDGQRDHSSMRGSVVALDRSRASSGYR